MVLNPNESYIHDMKYNNMHTQASGDQTYCSKNTVTDLSLTENIVFCLTPSLLVVLIEKVDRPFKVCFSYLQVIGSQATNWRSPGRWVSMYV